MRRLTRSAERVTAGSGRRYLVTPHTVGAFPAIGRGWKATPRDGGTPVYATTRRELAAILRGK